MLLNLTYACLQCRFTQALPSVDGPGFMVQGSGFMVDDDDSIDILDVIILVNNISANVIDKFISWEEVIDNDNKESYVHSN